MEKIVNKLINHMIKGVDTYVHGGSTWLIFTDTKEWVVELTEDKTLWYNYNFFKGMFNYASLDVVENQHYITKWVEDNIINGVKEISSNVMIFQSMKVEDAIQNGVKETFDFMEQNINEYEIDDTIKNGVKETHRCSQISDRLLEDTIQNGVKETQFNSYENKSWVEGVIENGVKHTEIGWHQCNNIDDAIEYGVKETMFNQGHKRLTVKNIIENGVRHTLNTEYMPTSLVEDIIENGVKETFDTKFMPKSVVEDIIQSGVKEINSWDESIVGELNQNGLIEEIIENGIKETQPLPDQSGELIGYGNYYHDKEDKTKAFYNYLEDTIKFGVKKSIG